MDSQNTKHIILFVTAILIPLLAVKKLHLYRLINVQKFASHKFSSPLLQTRSLRPKNREQV